MKKISFFLCAVLMTMIGFAQGSETFDNLELEGTSYQDGSFTGDDGLTFNYMQSRDENDFPITGNGLMLRKASDSYLEWTIPNGIGELTFDYRKAHTGGSDRQLEVLVNGDQVNTSDEFGAGTGEDDTIHSLTTTIDEEGEVTIRIKNVGTTTGNRQAVIDNISWTAFEEAPEPDGPVELNSAGNFGILAYTTITSIGPSVISDMDIGVSPGTAITGFPPATIVNGEMYTSVDADPVPAMLTQAKQDLSDAYNYAAGASAPAPATVAGDQGGLTLAPGIYKSESTLSIQSGDLTLDAQGDPDATWIFQIASDLTTVGGAGGNVILADGAQADNITWQVGSSATIGNSTSFKGNILAYMSITMNTGATIDGRLLAMNGAVVLSGTNLINNPAGILEDCLAPTNVQAGQATFVEGQALVPITWTAGGSETEWEVEYVNTNDSNDTDIITVNGNPETVLELDINTGYDVQVRSVCGEENSDWASTATVFTTPFPCENPEVTATIVALEGGGLLECVLPGIPFQVKLEISGGQGNDSFTVLDGDGAVISDDVESGDVLLIDATLNILDIFSILNYTVIGNNTDECGLEVSVEIEICAAPPCEAPELVEASNITEDSADITWSGGPDTGIWIIAYGENPYLPGEDDGDFVFDDMEETLTGLDAGTQYDVFVRTVCDEDGEDLSDWTNTSFTTDLPDCIFPDFSLTVTNSDGELIDCVEEDGSYYLEIVFSGGSEDHIFTLYDYDDNLISDSASSGDIFLGGPYDADESAGFYGLGENCDGGFETEFVSVEICEADPCIYPDYSLTVTNVDGEPIDCVEEGGSYYVEIELSGGSEDHTFTIFDYDGIIAEDASSGDVIQAGPYDADEVVGFSGTGENCDGAFETENVSVEICEAEECPPPTGISFGLIDFSSAEVSWTPGDATQDKWEVVYGPAPFDPLGDDGESVIVEDNANVTLTSLTPGTTYQIYVRALCGEDDEPGDFTDPDDVPVFETPEYYISLVETTDASQNVNNPTNNDGYTDYTNDEDKIIEVYSGQDINGIISIITGGEEVNFGIYVDLNQDGFFGTAPMGNDNTATSGWEQTLTLSNQVDGDISLFIETGVGLVPGQEYTVRVQVKKSELSPNDLNFTDGETEDYLIRVLEDLEDPEYFIDLVETSGAVENINNPTGNDGYTDYTTDETKIVTISEGQSVLVTVSIQSSGEPVNFGGWIDLDGDGLFGTAPMGDDNSAASGFEQIHTVDNLLGGEVGILAGPGLVAGNEYRARLQVKKSALSPNDTGFTDGETEDYLIRVLPADCEDPYNDDAGTSDVYISSIEISGIGADLGDPTYDLSYTSNDMSTTGYDVITNPILTVYPGLEGTYTVSSGPAGNPNQYYYSVWIDFNQNGCFEADEQVIWSDNDLWNGGIPNGEPGVEDVPMTWGLGMAPGTYQARIRNSMVGYPLAEGNGDGEALDFTVEVITEADANSVLGVDNQMFTDFTYYPNPVKNQLNLHAGTTIEQVEVYNLLGQKVIQVQPNALETSLDTGRLQSGVYLMNVTIDGSQKTFRIVKK